MMRLKLIPFKPKSIITLALPTHYDAIETINDSGFFLWFSWLPTHYDAIETFTYFITFSPKICYQPTMMRLKRGKR